MTDHPATWLSDPTGRHDHRYWDGTQWTDHVADAGVAAVDPYDGPPGATPPGPSPTQAAESTTTPSGWGTSGPSETAAAQPTPSEVQSSPSVSGWGASQSAEPTVPAAADPGVPAASPWSAPTATPSPWGEPAPSAWTGPATVDAGTETDAGVGQAPTGDATDVAAAPTWGEASVAPSTTWDDPTAVAAAGDAPTTTWSTGRPIEPPSEPATGAPGGDGGSRKGIVLVVALLAIVAVVVALVLVGDDDKGGTDKDVIASRLADQLQEQVTTVSDQDARCIGDYVVDEIGASRLEDVDFSASSAPEELEQDFNDAFNDAITECSVDLSGGAADLGDGTTDASVDSSTPQNQEEFERLLTEQYQAALGLSEDKARCLAQAMAGAIQSGELDEGAEFGEFFQYLEGCGISLEELQQGATTTG